MKNPIEPTLSLRQRIRTFSCGCLVLCIFSSALPAADNAFLGNWTLNVEKSKFPPGFGVKRETVKFELDGDKVKRTAMGEDEHGNPIRQGGPQGDSQPWDGKDYEIIQPNGPTAVLAIKMLNDHAVYVTQKRKMGGPVVVWDHSVVSADGKTLTTAVDGLDDKGGKFHIVEVFDKQP